jgi:hypothetical protein
LISKEDSSRESQAYDLEELIRSPTSRKAIQAPSWLKKISRDRAEEFLIDRILDNLSGVIPDSVLQLTAESHLTVDKISQTQECKDAIKNRKREFTFQLKKKLPAFRPWVEFTPKLAGIGVAKLRFEYVAEPGIAAKDVTVTILNGRLSDVSIDSLDASIQMSVIVDGQRVKLGTIHSRLKLRQRLSEMTELLERPVDVTKLPDLSRAAESKFCMECGASIPTSAKFCGRCGAKQAQ